MVSRDWIQRRGIAVVLLIPGYLVGWVCARLAPALLPWVDWNLLSPYLAGAIGSTAFNTLMWDYWVMLVYRFGGKPQEA